MEAVDSTAAALEAFLAPVRNDIQSKTRLDQNLLDKIALADHEDVESSGTTLESRRQVLREGLRLLTQLHQALMLLDLERAGSDNNGLEYTALPNVNGVMDLLFLEGVYPELLAGVGYPQVCRSRSLLYRDLPPDYDLSPGLHTYVEIVNDMGYIFNDLRKGLEPFIEDQYQPDFVAAAAQAAFTPNSNDPSETLDKQRFSCHIQKLSTDTALRTLTVLNQPSAPEWLRAVLTEYLSLIPLRSGGLLETITFVASLYTEHGEMSTVPKEAIDQVSKLFSTAPRSVPESKFFSEVAPQLLRLLDGQAGPQFSNVAGVIIGQRILGKKSWGAPSAIGWKWFVKPIHQAIDPKESVDMALTTDQNLRTALQRLSRLVAAHPNPGLVARLLSPILLPLWGLCAYSRSRPVDKFWVEASRQLVVAYLKLTSNAPAMHTIATNLLFDGRPAWEYAPGGDGGVEIRKTTPTNNPPNIISLVSNIDTRVKLFIELLKASSLADTTVVEVLAGMTKTWLSGAKSQESSSISKQLGLEIDPAQGLARAKLMEAMLVSFKHQIARRPQAVLFLVKELLEGDVNSIKQALQRKESLKNPTIQSLGQIVQQADSSSTNSTAEEDHEVISIALSLISVTLSSESGIEASTEVHTTLKDIDTSLDYLQSLHTLPEIRTSMSTTRALIQPYFSSSSHTPPQSTEAMDSASSRLTLERPILNEIREDIHSPVPPIRAEALSALAQLITSRSPVIDVPSITLLLLYVISNDPEEFVYLKAMQTLSVLAANADPRLVTRFALEDFTDEEAREELDSRLRVGEGIASLLDVLVEHPGVEAAESVRRIARAVLHVSGRRGERMKHATQPKQQVKQSLRLSDLVVHEGQDPKEERTKQEEAIAKIVGGWSDTGREEDVRIRTSALSVMGKILARSHGLSILSDDTIKETVDLALGVLALERDMAKAILRRAAVLVFLELLKGLDEGLDAGQQSAQRYTAAESRKAGKELDAQKWAEVERVLSWTRDVDEDEIVRGHAEVVLESLEAWRMKNLLAAGKVGEGDGLRIDTRGTRLKSQQEGELRGLAVRLRTEDGNRRVIEEIE